jgi:hypothetical protein
MIFEKFGEKAVFEFDSSPVGSWQSVGSGQDLAN